MNNKGQSLVVFVIIMPLILMLLMSLWELGNLSYTQSKYENEIKNVISYGLNNLDKEDLEENLNDILNANLDGEKELTINDGVITIHVKEKYQKTYTILKGKITIDITYKGYKENGKNILIKE